MTEPSDTGTEADRPGMETERTGTGITRAGTGTERTNETVDETETMIDDNTRPADDRTANSNDRSVSTENRRARKDNRSDDPDGSGFDRFSGTRLRGILDRFALVALGVLAVIAGWSFYGHVGAAIRTWLDPAYQPIALAAFNLAVLFVALAGLTHQLRRLREDGERDAEPASTE